ncbi:LLM class F420-dependent oxidoreductase [Nocardia farcinica]|uniref:LLM class F420-dependent oxidoreductase n=1 Tax=Nocardia farcinica TaxID=37329 RepID=UPI003799D10C
MRFVFHYPEVGGRDGDVLDAGPLGAVAVAAEAAGFDALSLSEHPVPGAAWLDAGGHQTLDPFVALAYVAAATERLRLLTYLAVAPYRNPFLLAKAAATLDKLSGGRLTLGLGVGYQKREYHALGIPFEERNARFDEALEALPRHWSGEPFSCRGNQFNAQDVIARPRPVQQPIPIWIGGNSALTRRRVAQRAQGWMPMSGGARLSATARTPALGSITELAAAIRDVRTAAAEAGRAETIDVLYSYQGAGIEKPAADADRHRAAFAELEQVGVTWIVVSSRTREVGATLEFLDAFGSIHLR